MEKKRLAEEKQRAHAKAGQVESFELRALEDEDRAAASLLLLRKAKGPGIEMRDCKPRRAVLRRALYFSRAAHIIKAQFNKASLVSCLARDGPIPGMYITVNSNLLLQRMSMKLSLQWRIVDSS
jgi:hypothetical protein